MMLTIAQGRTSSNLMSQIVSKADSMSVEADLRQLAKRTQSSAQGGSASNCSRIISELRDLVEAGKVAVNRPGESLWWTTEGLFAIYPRILDDVMPKLVAKQIPGIPASKAEIAQILVETGFLMPAEADTVDGKQSSSTWDLHVTIESKGEPLSTHKLRTIRFVEPGLIMGNRPLPPPQKAEAKPPFVDIKTIDKNMEAVKVLGLEAPLAAASDARDSLPAQAGDLTPSSNAPSSTPIPSETAKPRPFVPPHNVTGSSESTRNKRDMADAISVEKAISREKRGIPEQMSIETLMERLSAAGMEGMAIAEIFERIIDARYGFHDEYSDTLDGLAVHYPDAFEGLGISPSDIMTALAQKGWLVIESGSDRKINERNFGELRRKCLIFTGQPAKVWEALKKDQPGLLSERDRKKVSKPAPTPTTAPNVPTPTAEPQDRRGNAPAKDRNAPPQGSREENARSTDRQPNRNPNRPTKERPFAPEIEVKGTNISTPADKPGNQTPQKESAIAAKTLFDLTEEKVAQIKSAARMVLERDLFQIDVLPEKATSEQIRQILLRFAARNQLELAPMCKALLTHPPVLVAKDPPMYDFALITEMALNPAFHISPSDREMVEKAIESIKARRSKQGDKE